jgi:hypothetical protein
MFALISTKKKPEHAQSTGEEKYSGRFGKTYGLDFPSSSLAMYSMCSLHIPMDGCSKIVHFLSTTHWKNKKKKK